ncbi:MAG: hypothetical protein QOC72_310, partial [Methylobacteriaceae bacterium]|nr:hypothetical protein [Methylobacteriaceae bacterium]
MKRMPAGAAASGVSAMWTVK